MGTPKKAAQPKAAPQAPKPQAPAKAAPEVGKTCTYTPAENDKQLTHAGKHAAIITNVGEKCAVNLQVFTDSITGLVYYSNVPAGTGPHSWQ